MFYIGNVEKSKLSMFSIFQKGKSRCSITRLESKDSVQNPSFAIAPAECNTDSTSGSISSSLKNYFSPGRRGSMMELSSTRNKILEEDFLSGLYIITCL